MSPQGEGIKTALDAMRSDAGLWREQAQAMGGPKRTVESLRLDPADVSYFSVQLGLDRELETLRTAVADLLGQGQEYFTKIGGDLDDAANQYQADDEAAQNHLREIN